MTSRSAADEAAAIVPAYNEEKTVGDVVRTLVASGAFRDVVVISDGSTDGTAAAARAAGATMVHELREKGGKGAALLHGVRHTTAPILLFADADLRGFTIAHVRLLLDPVIRGEKMMMVGLRDRGPLFVALEARLPLVGGERGLRREVIEGIPPVFLRGFRVEAALNYHCRSRRWAYGSVRLPGLMMRKKAAKVGPLRAIPEYAIMTYQVASAMLSVRLARLRGAFPARLRS